MQQPHEVQPSERDPQSGYASPDVLEAPAAEPTEDPLQDAMSGYASADALTPEATPPQVSREDVGS